MSDKNAGERAHKSLLMSYAEKLSGDGTLQAIRARDKEIWQLKAENEVLRKVANELRRFASCEHLHHDKPDRHEEDEPCKVLARIDAAMSKEPKSE